MTDPGPDNLFEMRERRERRSKALRWKQFNAVLTTIGYATLGGGGWDPLLKGTPIKLTHVLALLFGATALGLSVYNAPETEVDDVR